MHFLQNGLKAYLSKMLGQLLGEYFDSTTIHGFAYIHGREHWAIRMLWVYYSQIMIKES